MKTLPTLQIQLRINIVIKETHSLVTKPTSQLPSLSLVFACFDFCFSLKNFFYNISWVFICFWNINQIKLCRQVLKQKSSFTEAPITHKYLIQSKSVFPIQSPNLLNKNVSYIKYSLKIKMVAFRICSCITFPCGEFTKPFCVKCTYK